MLASRSVDYEAEENDHKMLKLWKAKRKGARRSCFTGRIGLSRSLSSHCFSLSISACVGALTTLIVVILHLSDCLSPFDPAVLSFLLQ
ncbi:hypothetical protein Nepgr_013912 [Nepenthes gracilis]|uniref:Uncharacterized protein n=1 Tax=Nepenthes gracilis TaxID=150966 RepID=A0AAD3SKK7_NEPGR|nr:hypothetical protein Nepgr_013912 [Nepenthes gracilis]